MQLIFFSSVGWESWDVECRPVIPDGMPVLVDDDLVFDDASGSRPATVVNRWLRELPSSGCPARSSWESYARVLRSWMQFLTQLGIGLFDGVTCAALYTTYLPLKEVFERRRDQLRDAGVIADPRDVQIDRLKQQVHQLKQRLSAKEQQYTELTAFCIQALSRLAAQHEEVIRLRAVTASADNVHTLSAARYRAPAET